jgi:hemolysin III
VQTAWPQAPRWLSVPGDTGLDWAAVFVFPDLLHNGGIASIVLVAAGGWCYTVGGVIYAMKRPNPGPGSVGFHEVFHTCTLVAAVCHYIAKWLAVFR